MKGAPTDGHDDIACPDACPIRWTIAGHLDHQCAVDTRGEPELTPCRSHARAFDASTDDLTGIWQLPPDKRQSAMLAAFELAGEF